MTLVNPFSSKKEGNSRERLTQLEGEVYRLKGILMTYGALFEMMRRFFVEITKVSSVSPDKQDSGTDSAPADQLKPQDSTEKA